MQITLTAAQLTRAQLGQDQDLNTGETLCAVPLNDGAWKYLVSFEGVCGYVRYAKPGLDAALWALNATEEDYSAA
jgi:hypothetical protein